MKRKPLGVLFSEFVKDEFDKSGLSISKFCQKHNIGLASMDKIIHKKGFGFVTGYMDRLLDEFGADLQHLINEYGEYYEE